MSSWKRFGDWIYTLNSDITLSPARTGEIRKMTDSIKNDKDKARFLYNYLQQSMRYVGIQMGIGGYKPFAASFVDDKKYGDCFAFSFFLLVLFFVVVFFVFCV